MAPHMKNLLLVLSIIILCQISIIATVDFYEILGVSRTADTKEIRKAFKKLAVTLHPDKNPENEKAQSQFIEIARAYEVLKDESTRKKYDQFGEEGLDGGSRPQYKSYTYYRDHFGIYDDDPLVVTLSNSDYDNSIGSSAWFINLYSTQCSHCHDLAPTWRSLAAEMEGVLKVAAINCEEDWSLCRRLGAHSYPTLLYLSVGEKHPEQFRGSRTLKHLIEFVLKRVKSEVHKITQDSWNRLKNNIPWLLFSCSDESSMYCPEFNTQVKLAAILEGLVLVGVIEDANLSKSLSLSGQPVFIDVDNIQHYLEEGSDSDIANQILELLPNVEQLNESGFQDARTRLRLGSERPWLICFYMGTAKELDLQLKRLPVILPEANVASVHCGRYSQLCASLHINKYPTWGSLKLGGAFELYHGKDVVLDIAKFAQESFQSVNFHALSPADMRNILKENQPWMVEWYAPWCPPCRKLLPEIRKASTNFGSDQIQFGTLDCTIHARFCTEHNVRSYPTTILYNSTKKYEFHGQRNSKAIIDFIEEIMSPVVMPLTENLFKNKVVQKQEEEMWLVTFSAPWCHHCQILEPEWRKMAKEMVHLENVYVGSIDCVAEKNICSSQGVRSYPTIRLYPKGSKGLNTMAVYNGHRDANSLRRWAYGFIPSRVSEMNNNSLRTALSSGMPILVMFHAPWCHHCVQFQVEFITVSQKMTALKFARVNCDNEPMACQYHNINSYPTVKLFLSGGFQQALATHHATQLEKDVRYLLQINLPGEGTATYINHDEL